MSIASEVDEEKATGCPRCKTVFTTTFRRHHCRQCGGLVCDDCSRHRVRLSRNPLLGKVRVCDACVSAISEHQATGFEEDLAVNHEIIAQLRSALSKSYAECETFKRMLLELEADALGDGSALESFSRDPESDAHSFPALRDRVEQQWALLLQQLDEQRRLRQELEERRSGLQEQRTAAASQEQELRTRRAVLDNELAEVAKVEAARDELVRVEAELERAVAGARRRVQLLELERKERQEREAQRRGRWRSGNPAASPGPSPPGSPPAMAFTISTGRADPLLAGGSRNRLEGCRRACAVM